MKIGIKASYMDLLDKQKIKNLHKEKIKYIELKQIKQPLNKDILDQIKNEFEYSLHAPFYNMKISLINFLNYPKIAKKEIELSLKVVEELEAKEFIMHAGSFFRGYVRLTNGFDKKPGLNLFLDKFVKTFGTILKEANQSGIKVVIENSYPCFLLGRPSDIIYIQNKLPFLGFCLDIGHAEIYDQTEKLLEFKIDHIHISDNNKKSDQHLKLGEGSINFREILKKLKEKGYNGKIIPECRSLENSIKSYKFLNLLLKESKEF